MRITSNVTVRGGWRDSAAIAKRIYLGCECGIFQTRRLQMWNQKLNRQERN
jgi:hypothetical protein